MKIEQLYTGCLSQGAYYIESKGEAAIIDPLREIQGYLKKAEKDGAKIKYIFETHFHADFVSGHLDLAKATGAEIVFGPEASPEYPSHIARDGEEFSLGEIKIRVIHTPGHTLESTCYLLLDATGKPHALFSGDTLFIGDVGRPDLAIKGNLTQERLAEMLYHSIRERIMPLPDSIIIYPAHGAGSACGKHISKETFDTLEHQKKVNFALSPSLSKGDFIKQVTTGLLPPPAYFPENALMNKQGYTSIGEVLRSGNQPLSPDEFESLANSGALMIDTRKAEKFAEGHIPNSINIGLDGQFGPWVGTLIPDLRQPIILIAEENKEEEVITRLARVGYDNTLGFLKGGIEGWQKAGKEIEIISSVSPQEFLGLMKKQDLKILDVRRPAEYGEGHLEKAVNTPLDFINDINELNKQEQYFVHCAGGYRSMIFTSIMKARGYDMVNIEGGYNELKKEIGDGR